MQKTKILKILNPMLAVLLIFQLVSGLLPAIVPYDVHRIVGILLGGGVGLHLILNWPWIRANLLKR
jgi:hypothetical protein